MKLHLLRAPGVPNILLQAPGDQDSGDPNGLVGQEGRGSLCPPPSVHGWEGLGRRPGPWASSSRGASPGVLLPLAELLGSRGGSEQCRPSTRRRGPRPASGALSETAERLGEARGEGTGPPQHPRSPRWVAGFRVPEPALPPRRHGPAV